MSQQTEQVQVTVEQIQGYLNEGKTRQEIAETLGISMTDCREMFKHPLLKGKKPKSVKTLGFVFVDNNNVQQNNYSLQEEEVAEENNY